MIVAFEILRTILGKTPLFWRARQESNLRPLASEANTLSTELRAPAKLHALYCKCLIALLTSYNHRKTTLKPAK